MTPPQYDAGEQALHDRLAFWTEKKLRAEQALEHTRRSRLLQMQDVHNQQDQIRQYEENRKAVIETIDKLRFANDIDKASRQQRFDQSRATLKVRPVVDPDSLTREEIVQLRELLKTGWPPLP